MVPEEFAKKAVAAYEATGLVPCAGDWVRNRGTCVHACALAACYAVDMGGVPAAWSGTLFREYAMSKFGVSEKWVNGNIMGFDGGHPVGGYEYPQDWIDGFASGRAARKAVGLDV